MGRMVSRQESNVGFDAAAGATRRGWLNLRWTGGDVDVLLARDDFHTTRLEEDRGYIREHLRSAQAFTARMQTRGWGLVYLIG